ncbi:MAG: GNAT family N-acetyltransferase [candidate division Zixibacteria bacterium]
MIRPLETPTLYGENVTLRRLKRSDRDDLKTAAGHRSVSRYLSFMPYPYTSDHARKLINRTHRWERRGLGCCFGISDNRSSRIVGVCDLFNYNHKDSLAEIGYWLGRDSWHRGFMSESVQLILRYAFQTLRLHRVYAVTSCRNKWSIHLLKKAGFAQEATWRSCTRRGNRWDDAFGFGLLKSEFKG